MKTTSRRSADEDVSVSREYKRKKTPALGATAPVSTATRACERESKNLPCGHKCQLVRPESATPVHECETKEVKQEWGLNR